MAYVVAIDYFRKQNKKSHLERNKSSSSKLHVIGVIMVPQCLILVILSPAMFEKVGKLGVTHIRAGELSPSPGSPVQRT